MKQYFIDYSISARSNKLSKEKQVSNTATLEVLLIHYSSKY
jgi:hypothetical protein